MKKVKIALLGLGNVGRGVWMILNSNKEEIMKRCGYEVEIAKVLVRDKNKPRGIEISDELVTTDFNEILKDSSIKIVVEVMGGMEPAREYMLRCMENKKHIVTANKMLLATGGDELFEKADENGIMFSYEASVAGGIPIIKGIDESLTANKIETLYGIVNGTTNYILSKMELEGADFDDVLKEAQEKGYAEADPTSDIEGYDAQYKLAILASLAFGSKIDVKNVYREGITKIEAVDMKYAKEFKMGIKLLAIAKETNGKVELRVHPTMIPKKHPLSNVYDSYNAVFIRGNAVGDLMFYGRGAGDLPTGSAVVSDIVSIVRNNVETENPNPVVKNNLWEREILDMGSVESKFYIRATVLDESGVLGEITAILGKHNVSIRSVIQKGDEEDGQVTIVLVTHRTSEAQIDGAVEEITSLKSVYKIDNIIRIEDFK
ncbi:MULTISPECIES: homoserine dehydrogenase [Clostridium]|jgi:homoserine dehydrogenase|uniref:Homoserine dehydrogenase n=2 Tax=Clostridium beijerinckii TaxID=1520 RepID=A0AAE2RV51_CLOBE|nr:MULTISPECIES: homoserine dehydrogenase [Clostridium]ABR33725.1 Homoserine dehydrogenase [Clostridium beijerinckii NCIMB 8052]AIU00550.1 homoserine dehydrogenase [Clostridium beijerinckii ATCC 35702]ALB47165.1 homoserine dehydrogenase [Clostridium beijerinckii NRRL B-598]MBE6089026.1 homoserine dehydrogenase [Clostridium beijerinckii]MBF7812147.1 homoserine dehydrogenase [Clostridium beijerinckii]